MSKPNWLDVETGADVMIIDLGYLTEESSRDRADKLFALGIGKKNLIWGPSTGDPRIHMNIPKTKREAVLATFTVSNKKTWFGATHSWLN
jgi:hypothetical protein